MKDITLFIASLTGMTDKEILEKISEEDHIPGHTGSFLEKQADIIEDQKGWYEPEADEPGYEDYTKIDLTRYDFWLTTDDGATPEGIHNLNNLVEIFN